jgi:DNA-binding XRE family transcriptional regulator
MAPGCQRAAGAAFVSGGMLHRSGAFVEPKMSAHLSRIAELRRTARLSQQDVAVSLGVAVSTVRRWEAGTAAPTASHARKLARRLGVSLEALGPLGLG